jgi:hypothetical protein
MRRCSPPVGSGWCDMSTAPRDGTVVELCCTYGVVPWYGVYRWSDELTTRLIICGTDGDGRPTQRVGEPITGKSEATWRDHQDSSKSVRDEAYLSWRPYERRGAVYVDPTGGLQDTVGYWRRACSLPARESDDRLLADPGAPARAPETIAEARLTACQRALGWAASFFR